jgi:hypothetical protein
MEGEAKLYYHNFYDEFSFYKSDTEESFLETFPFHPLSYETVRRFTSSVQDMPGVRLGLNIFYDVMKSETALAQDNPITLHHVHKFSPNFEHALASPRFADSQRRFRDGLGLLSHIFTDEEDRNLAEAILTILYLHYAISGEQAIPMSAAELADATLTQTGAITGEQRMVVLLGEMAGKIPQLEFDSAHVDKGARFIPKPVGPTPQQLLDKIKNEYATRDMEINECWTKLLFALPTETRGQKTLFSGNAMDKVWNDSVVVNQLSYEGEIVVAGSWRPDLGFPINDPYSHFRLVYLLNGNSSITSQLQDSRIVVIEVSPLSERLKDLCCTYLASKSLMSDFDPLRQKGPEAAEIRAFVETKFGDALSTIIRYQSEPFQKGKAHTKQGVNLDVGSALIKPTHDQRLAAIIRPLLENAYPEFQKIFDVLKIEKQIVPADAKNLVLGLVQGDTTKAVRSTLEQKSVGLGLSMPNDPKMLNPQHSQFFKILDARIATNPAVILWPLLKEMAGCPYGIPPFLFTPMLLIYVRSRNVPTPVEITLNPQHKLTNASGKPLSKNLITRANVVELQWQSDMERFFDSLVAVSGPDWNSIQPYAKLIWSDAKAATFPQEIDNQISGFLGFLKNQLPLVQGAAINLKTLAEGLKDTLSETDSEYLKKFSDLYAADDLDTFDAQRKVIQPELPGFKSAVERVTSLRQLAGISTQILQMLNALQMTDVGPDEELSVQKSMLLVRYKLSSMIGNETVVKALLNDTDKFLQKVKNAQEIHAPRMMELLKKLKESLNSSSILLKGLGQLNQITTLGPPQGHDLANRLENLLNNIEKELTGESNLHRSLSYSPPENEVRDISNKIKEAFENRAAILRGQLEKVIQEKGKDQLKTLLHLIQINKLPDVATNLSPAIIGTIQKILEEARTQVVRSRVLEQVAEQFPAVGKEDLDKFITELKKLLEKEFADKTQEGKKIVLTFK